MAFTLRRSQGLEYGRWCCDLGKFSRTREPGRRPAKLGVTLKTETESLALYGLDGVNEDLKGSWSGAIASGCELCRLGRGNPKPGMMTVS